MQLSPEVSVVDEANLAGGGGGVAEQIAGCGEAGLDKVAEFCANEHLSVIDNLDSAIPVSCPLSVLRREEKERRQAQRQK